MFILEAPFTVQLAGFEGPLDLLLQLVEKEKVDIFEVPLAKIADEYVAVLEEMERANLEVGGEFLVIASQLTYIKSRLLLPKPPVEAEEEPSAEEMRLAFLQRLEAYRLFQEAARALGQREHLGRDVFLRGLAGAEEPPPRELSVELFSLLEAFEAVLKRAKIRVPHEVMIQRLSLADRISQVIDRLQGRKRLSFEDLFDDVIDRAGLVVTFLAILELAKLRLLHVFQPDLGAQLQLSLRESPDGPELS